MVACFGGCLPAPDSASEEMGQQVGKMVEKVLEHTICEINNGKVEWWSSSTRVWFHRIKWILHRDSSSHIIIFYKIGVLNPHVLHLNLLHPLRLYAHGLPFTQLNRNAHRRALPSTQQHKLHKSRGKWTRGSVASIVFGDSKTCIKRVC